jgi:hypothetical protein
MPGAGRADGNSGSGFGGGTLTAYVARGSHGEVPTAHPVAVAAQTAPATDIARPARAAAPLPPITGAASRTPRDIITPRGAV